MDKDTQKALRIFYELRNELQKSDESLKLKQLNKIISLLESSFFNDIVALHKSLNEQNKQKKHSIEHSYGNGRNVCGTNKRSDDSGYNNTKTKCSSRDDFNRRVKLLVGNRELLHIEINKSRSEPSLGFSIKCSGSSLNNAVFVDSVTKGSLADRSGIRTHYQIVAVDDIPLDSPDSNRDIVVQALKSGNSHIDLYLSREKSANVSNAPQSTTRDGRKKSDHNFPKELNTEWTEYEVIFLKSVDGSFGFGIMAGMANEVIVRTVLSGGAADLDGRLRSDDHLMYINDRPVRHLSSTQVASILKGCGDNVRLVVARPFYQGRGGNDRSRHDRVQMVETAQLDDRLQMIVGQLHNDESINKAGNTAQTRFSMSYREENADFAEFLTVQLLSTGSNIGITLVNMYDEDPNHLGTLQGIFINDVVVNSVAYKGGVRRYDRLLKINGAPLENYDINVTVHRLLHSSGSVTLYLQRYLSGPTLEKLRKSEFFGPRTVSVILERPGSSQSEGSSVSDIDIDEYYKLVT